jgi:HlyD family secretion protein
MNKKISAFLILTIILIVFILSFLFFNRKDKNIIESYGNVEIRQVDLSFQVNGVIDNVFFEEGDYVHKGDLLATLDDKDYKANYKKALFQEQTTKINLEENYSKYKRNLPLCQDDTISKEECTTLLNNKNYYEAKLNQDKANKEYVKNQLDYTKLYAKQDGIISTRVQEKGARIQAGQIVYVMNLFHPVWIRTYVNEKDLANIKYGMKADILTDTVDINTGKKKSYKGKIGYISPVAEFSPKTVQTKDIRVDLMYRLRIYVDEFDEFLRQGMPVTIQIKLDKNNELYRSKKLI